MRVEYIYRYPVKGMRAERLQRGVLKQGAGLVHDRAFAFTSGNQPAPKDDRSWTPSRSFIQMTVYPKMAGFTASIDDDTGALTISAPDDATASTQIRGGDDTGVNALMNRHFTPGPEGGIYLHRRADPHGLWDFSDTSLSIINLASVEWLEWVSGLTLSHLRFRGNIYITGLEPFEEFALAGQTLRIGEAKLKVLRPAMRCAATAADPWSGDTSIDVVGLLRAYTQHVFCGIYAAVLQGGEIFEDDHLRMVDEPVSNPLNNLPERTPDPVLWPRPARVEALDGDRLVLSPDNSSWPFLPANAGARLIVHPGLDYMRDPVRTALVERGSTDRYMIASTSLEQLMEGSRVLVSGPVERSSGKA